MDERQGGVVRTGDPTPPGLTVPCWLCARPIAVRRSKDGHHFLTCMDCGMQIFVRSAAGEEKLRAVTKPGNGT